MNAPMLKTADLRAWIENQEVLYASETRNNKRLTMNIRVADGAAIITYGQDEIFRGCDLDHAIQVFNDAW